MNPISGTPPNPILEDPAARQGRDTPSKIHDAASQFEALLMGQILKTGQGEGGWLGNSEDPSSASAVDFATDFLAQSLASTGGLGLAHMIEHSLNKQALSSSSPATDSPPLPGTPMPGQ